MTDTSTETKTKEPAPLDLMFREGLLLCGVPEEDVDGAITDTREVLGQARASFMISSMMVGTSPALLTAMSITADFIAANHPTPSEDIMKLLGKMVDESKKSLAEALEKENQN